MFERPAYNETFCRVANPRKPDETITTQYGALFSSDLKELGAEGFSQWIVDSFGTENDAPRPGHFHYGRDPGEGPGIWFFEALQEAAPSFTAEIVGIARAGLLNAVDRLNPKAMSVQGIVEVLETGAILGMPEIVDQLADAYVTKATQVWEARHADPVPRMA